MVKNLPANARDIRDLGLISGLGRSPGGVHGNPLQYSCLGNHMDRGAWWATFPGTTKSQTKVSDWTQLTTYKRLKLGSLSYTIHKRLKHKFWTHKFPTRKIYRVNSLTLDFYFILFYFVFESKSESHKCRNEQVELHQTQKLLQSKENQ